VIGKAVDMYLTNPLLPINVSQQKAVQDVKEALEKKQWHDFDLGKPTLILVPYFLYNYHYYVEQSSADNNLIKETFDGILTINGHAIKIEEEFRDLVKYNWKKGSQTTPKGEFDEKWNNIDKKQQNEIIRLKTAEYFDVPKSNVIITSVRKVLVPSYLFMVKLGEEEYELRLNAVDEKVWGIKDVPEREKGMAEITRETIAELKKPSSWLKYTKEMVSDAIKDFKSTPSAVKKVSKPVKVPQLGIDFFARKEVLLLIMLLALLLIYLTLFV
jgi:hypothetical protein